MATDFPTDLDDFVNPLPDDPRTAPDHAGQHSDANDAIEALEAKVGVDGSTDPASLDNQLENHAHTAAGDDGAIVSHDDLSGVTEDDHHARLHDHSNALGDAALDPDSIHLRGPLWLHGTVTDSLTANQNNYAPTNWQLSSMFRITTDASRDITGIGDAAQVHGHIIIIHNFGANPLVLKDESASSTAANRIALGSDLTLLADESAVLQYDATSARWRCISIGKVAAAGGHPDLATHDALGLATDAEVTSAVSAHTGDTTDAHDASAISVLDAAGDFTATDVEGALAELQSDNEAHDAAGDPHAGYRLESVALDHGALTGLTDDDHTQYVLKAGASISGALALTGDITATDVGTVSNWAPTGLVDAAVIRWNGASFMTLTGLTGGADGREIVLMNVTAAQNLLLSHDVTSTAANRFLLPHAISHNIGPNESAVLVYDGTLSRWRLTGRAAQAEDVPVATSGTSSSSGSSTSKVSRFDHKHPLAAAVSAQDFTVSQLLALTGDIQPTDVGTLNDYAPTNLATSSVIEWGGASAGTLTGLSGGADGRIIVLRNKNTGAGAALTITHQDSGSAGANRFFLPGAVSYILAATESVILQYSSSLAAWTILQPAKPQTNVAFSKAGVLTVGAGTFRWYNDTGRALAFKKMRISVGTAPTGAAILVDLNNNGTTVFSTQSNRPTIAISGNTGTTVTFNDLTIADGEYLTIDIDQVGSTIAGADLTAQVWMVPA